MNHLHNEGLIHKDLNLKNILWNIETNEIRIKPIGFGFKTSALRKGLLGCYHY